MALNGGGVTIASASVSNTWRGLGSVCIALAAFWLNLLAWEAFNPPVTAPEAPTRVAGLAYNAFQRWDSPLTQQFPAPSAIADDMDLLSGLTARVRTYSSSEFPDLPKLASARSLTVAAGVWLDGRDDNNDKEIRAAVAAANQHRNIERVIVGNETQLHGALTPAQLHAYLKRVRSAVKVPVSTAEPWHIWLKQPELVQQVDFITVHLLPYWEGVPVDQAVDIAFQRYEQLRQRFPKKRIVIGEVGWPSAGHSVRGAQATPDSQAAFVRDFVARAEARGLDYYLMEAIDQPWKRATEGVVGSHWGLYNAARQPKFSFSGAVYGDPQWQNKSWAAAGMALLLSLPLLIAFRHMRLAGRVAVALGAQLVVSLCVLLWSLPLSDYLHLVDWALLAFAVPALSVVAAVLVTQMLEFAEVFQDGNLRRRTGLRALPPGVAEPFVSIHLACCNEPAEMVIDTLRGLLRLDWKNFEVVVVDNNTTDPACWQPVQAFAAAHQQARQRALDAGQAAPAELRFFHLPTWPGYKAGALNFALTNTHPQAEWVGVVDADYQVRPDWLRGLAGHFSDAQTAVVQAPQAHRDWARNPLARMMNWEYEGFFRVGMHHRHERNALIQHGTMSLIRRLALAQAGAWSTQCICEDAELGLRLIERGWRLVYVDEKLGEGLVPNSFAAFRRQRERWAEGGMQILRSHWRALLGRSSLSWGQRYHFLAGWLPWIGDALHLLFGFVAMFWTIGMVLMPSWFVAPVGLFVVPLVVFVTVRAAMGPLMYARRVGCTWRDNLGAALAGMGLSHAIARGVMRGLAGQRAVFHVTDKARVKSNLPKSSSAWAAVREEGALLLALAGCMGLLALNMQPGDKAQQLWLVLLGLQALPYLAALACTAVGQWPGVAAVGASEVTLPARRVDPVWDRAVGLAHAIGQTRR